MLTLKDLRESNNIFSNKTGSYSEFEYIIRNYFKYQQTNILETLNKWESELTDINTLTKFRVSKEKFVNLVNKL